MIYYSIPCYKIIYRLKMYARSCVIVFLLYDIKYLYFVSLSVTTKIESYLILVLDFTETGSLIIKFIVTFYYAPVDATFIFSFL
jgi:hypothetical protein